MPKCVSGNKNKKFYDKLDNDCASIAYAVIGEKEVWIDYVM